MTSTDLQHVTNRDRDVAAEAPDGLAPAEWGGPDAASAPPAPSGVPLARYLAAVNRFKWLIAIFVLLGAAGGYTATRFIDPEYQVGATILLQNAGASDDRRAVQGAELLRASGWQDLLRSPSIADPVVIGLSLFVTPESPRDSLLFRSFGVDQSRLRPGTYLMTISGNSYSLSFKPGLEVEKGTLGDSIGRPAGFQWQPDARAFAGRKEVEFTVRTPRETSQELISKLRPSLNEGSSFLFLSLTGKNSSRTAATLNAWVEQFVAVATALKKRNVTLYSQILEGQREYAARALSDAEASLQSFRVATVTQPNEREVAINAGIELTNNSAFNLYFNQKVLADGIVRDRTQIERIYAEGTASPDGISQEALLSIPLVTNDPAAKNVVRAIEEQAGREAKLRQLRESYTDSSSQVGAELRALTTLRKTTVPRAVQAYLQELKLRESQLNATIAENGKELRSIPERTIEEQRRKRTLEVAADMYRNLDVKAQEAKLADAATVPDVTVQDSAIAPLSPTRNTAPVIILGAIAAALGAAILLAILLDQTDKRFRYPEQATNELGLFILGVVPVINTQRGRKGSDQAAQVVEAFRTIRMNVRYAADPSRPMILTVTSPGPNDGKSLIASNLALSFAEAGARTLLIDGDIRRGDLARTFGTPPVPGLVEYLDGTALIAEVLHPGVSHPNLTIMPAGARRRRAPELLATPRLSQLIRQMGNEYDVVIVDSPPLGAGFDAYALATATTNMALVLRSAVTDRKMAAAKMEVVHTLPVRVLGAMLNGIEMSGVYQYYSYYQNYQAADEEVTPRLTDGTSRRAAVGAEEE